MYVFPRGSIARPVGGRGCYKLVSEHGFDTEPRWAMLVVNETKFSE
jgi:hypothetical protein